jgi:hypothetical protein
MIVETLRDSVGRAIGVITRAVLGSPILRTAIRIIPTPIRRQIPRWGRRLRRMELESGPYPGQPRGLAPSDLDPLSIPYGYEIGERAGIGIFDVDRTRPTRIPRKVNGVKVRYFPSGSHLHDPKNRGCDPALDADRFRRMVQRVQVIDEASCTWPDPDTRVRLLRAAAASGTPVALNPHNDTDPGFGPELFAAMSSHSVEECLNDPEVRDLVAWRQWRATRPAAAPVHVTIVIATRRPEMVARWAPQIAAQTHRPLSVSVALHGEQFDPEIVEQINAEINAQINADTSTKIPVHITRCASDLVLGEVLQAATTAAPGDLIVKWDDDDLYSRDHIADLVRTWDTTGAMLVGKACDYVYLKGSDLTVRRIQAAREAMSRTMAGGTLCISRTDLDRLGGWDLIPSGVDVGLIARVQEAGGLAYRAMGFGYMMIREPSGHGHTWGVQDQHFLTPGTPQRRGLRTDWAQIDAPAAAIASVQDSALKPE